MNTFAENTDLVMCLANHYPEKYGKLQDIIFMLVFLYDKKWYIDIFNKLITKRAQHYRKRVFKNYDSRF